MSNYDRWLTTDRSAEAADAYADYVIEAWEMFAETARLPLDAHEDTHEAHPVYEAWLALLTQVDEYHSRIAAEEEAAS